MEFELKLSEFEWEDDVLRERKRMFCWWESEKIFGFGKWWVLYFYFFIVFYWVDVDGTSIIIKIFKGKYREIEANLDSEYVASFFRFFFGEALNTNYCRFVVWPVAITLTIVWGFFSGNIHGNFRQRLCIICNMSVSLQ